MSSDFGIHIQPPKDESAAYLKAIKALYKSLFPWQRKAIKRALKKKKNGRYYLTRFFSISAPCGSGKTTLLIALCIFDALYSDMNQKQLIIVPQGHIGMGFAKNKENYTIFMELEIENKIEKFEWNILKNHNFCDDECGLSESKTSALKKWLLTPSSQLKKESKGNRISGLNAVCCYHSLIIVWSKLTQSEKKLAIRNLTLNVDEAHHLKHVYYTDADFKSEEERVLAEEEATQIGRICTYIMNSGIKSSKIRTASATMFRGDKKFIFSPSAKNEFENFEYTWAEHFNTLGIKNFRFQYEEYTKDPIDHIVKNVLSELKERHLIIIPPRGNKWRKSDKKELDSIIAKLVEGGIKREEILDLVTRRCQKKNKELLLREPKDQDEANPPKYRVVIICMLGREGTDWCPCTRLHNGAHETTLTLAMQTIGRLLRRFLGKEDITAITYVKEFTAPEKITKRELLSDRTNAILLCMQLTESFRPLLFPTIPVKGKDEEGNQKRISLEEYLGDKYQDIKKELIERYDALGEARKSGDVESMVLELLRDYGVKEHTEEIKRGLMVHLAYACADKNKVSAPDLDGIVSKFLRDGGFDKVIEISKRTIYFANCNKEDFPIIDKITKKYFGIIDCFNYKEACAEVIKMGFKNMVEYQTWFNKQQLIEAKKDRMSA